jgi:signal transduction histidine kinase/GAF domain-containing protein
MTPKLVVYGPVGDQAEVESALRAALPDVQLRFVASYPSHARSSPPLTEDEVQQSDGLVCFFDEELPVKSNAPFLFLKGILDYYPYLPVVVVGEPGRHKDLFHKLRATRYLSRNAHLTPRGPRRPDGSRSLTVLGEEVRRALEAVWWSGVSQFDLPALIVTVSPRPGAPEGRILRANAAAAKRFGADLEGRPYRVVVEAAPAAALPPRHPILETIETGRGVSRYHEYPEAGRDARRTFLVCTPILGPKNEVRAVAVLFIEMNRWKWIFDAGLTLAGQHTPEQLYQAIVEQGRQLGYSRVRLYKYLPDTRQLVGVASAGMTAAQDQFFRTLAFSLESDPPSRDTLARKFPCLCIYDRDSSATSRQEQSDLVRYYSEDPKFKTETELGKAAVQRWIDAPLLMPQTDGNDPTGGFWGKLSIDNLGNDSVLDPRDVADVALFASAAARAIETVQLRCEEEQRQKQDREQRQVVRDYVPQLAKVYWGKKKGDKILALVVRTLLGLYQKLTGAEVVYYRERWHDALVLYEDDDEDLVIWQPRLGEVVGLQPPREVRREHGLIGVLLEDAGRRAEPQLFNEAHTEQLAQSRNNPGNQRWLEQNAAWFEFVRSAVCTPVVVRDELRGVFVGISGSALAFPETLKNVLSQFMGMAELWLEFARLHDDREWWVGNLRQVIDRLPTLARARNDDAFLAGLATLLTAHTGLGWNRVLIFNCLGSSTGGTAELRYALGGKGESAHRDLQEQLRRTFTDLDDLLALRMDNPEPAGRGADGQLRYDSLYDLCVRQPRTQKNPIRIYFGPTAPRELLAQESPSPEEAADPSFRWLFEKERMLNEDNSLYPSFAIPLALEREEWMRQMNLRFPGMFQSEAFAFPLWDAYSDNPAPLGLVVLDMSYSPQRAPEEIEPATRVFLDLVADLLASRDYERRLRNWLRFLPNLHHGKELKELFGDLRRLTEHLLGNLTADFPEIPVELARQLEELVGRLPASAGEQSPSVIQPREILSLLKQVGDKIDQWYAAQQTLNQRFGKDSDRPEIIADLGRHLDRLTLEHRKRYPPGQTDRPQTHPCVLIEGNWDKVRGQALDCEEYIFTHTFRSLVENAVNAACEQAASQGQPFPTVRIWVDAGLEPDPSGAFAKLAVLEITDNGPGIRPEMEKLIFMEGFTFRHAPQNVLPEAARSHKGRGLAFARAQLTSSHGELQLKCGQTPNHHRLGKAGATFVLHFGIPHHFSELATRAPEGDPVLVISEDDTRSALLARVVHVAGFAHADRITAANAGEVARHLAARNYPAAIVDFNEVAPGQAAPWLDVVRLLRSGQPECVVVALTSPEHPGVGALALKAGAAEVVPCSEEEGVSWLALLQTKLETRHSVVV